MHYRKFTPSSELFPFVECFFEMNGLAEKELDVQSPPSSFSAIVFNFSEPYFAYQGNTEKRVVPKNFVSGLFTFNYHIVLKGKIDMLGIVFKSCALHDFFNLRMSMLVNNRMDLYLLLGEKTEQLIQTLSQAQTIDCKIKIAEEFLLSLLPESKQRLNIINDAALYIDVQKGQIKVEEVAIRYNISKRYLEKHFLEKVGVSPKFYARIKRFVLLANKAVHSPKIDWQELVDEGGLHDQSHLVKEYLEFNKTSPAEYYKEHQEMIRFLEDTDLYRRKPEKE